MAHAGAITLFGHRITFVLLAQWFVLLLRLHVNSADLQVVEVEGSSKAGGFLADGTADWVGVADACEMKPSFRQDVKFYLIHCMEGIQRVRLSLKGVSLFNESGLELGHSLGKHPLFEFDLPGTNAPVLFPIMSCPDIDPSVIAKAMCDVFTFDIFRTTKAGVLENLGVTPVNGPGKLEPPFVASHYDYDAKLWTEEPFDIFAVTRGHGSRIGIARLDADNFTGHRHACKFMEQTHAVYHSPGIRASGVYTYAICVQSLLGSPTQMYTLNLHLRPRFSTSLSSFTLDRGYKLEPEFKPDVNEYKATVALSPKEFLVHLAVKDPHASVTFDCVDAFCDVEHFRDTIASGGRVSVLVKMPDNSKVPRTQIPRWDSVLKISVLAQDGGDEQTYIMTFHQNVSAYSQASQIIMGDTPCDLDPPFSPKHLDYTCSFNYKVSKKVQLAALLEEDSCKECQLLTKSPGNHADRHLSVSFQEEEFVPFEPGQMWEREFLSGEEHTVEFKIVSQDRITHTTYRIRVVREAPWYLHTSFTRAVAYYSSRIGLIMGMSSAGNVVAFARQAQFITLTTDLQGAPEIYKDYADSLDGFNMNFEKYLPDFGMPSMKELRKQAIQHMHIDTHSILHARYCFVYFEFGQRLANSVLQRHPADAENLVKELGVNLTEYRMAQMEGEEAVPYIAAVPQDGQTGRFDVDRMRFRKTELINGTEEHVSFSRRLEHHAESESARNGSHHHEKEGEDTWCLAYLSDNAFEKLEKEADAFNTTKDTYPRLVCPAAFQPAVEGLKLYHRLYQINDTMHSSEGRLILLPLSLLFLVLTYYQVWRLFLRNRQSRLKALEPWPLWLFLLDFQLITFSHCALDHVFAPKPLFFASAGVMQIFAEVVLVMFPCLFIGIMTWMLVESTQRSQRIVWSESLARFVDPLCNEIKVTIKAASLLRFVPGIGGILKRHVRACIPVRDQCGDPLVFGENENPAVLPQCGDEDPYAYNFEAEDEAENAETPPPDPRAVGPPWLEGMSETLKPLADIEEELQGLIDKPFEAQSLEPEERFALATWVEKLALREKLLLNYNIMHVSNHDGYLKPAEPIMLGGSRENSMEQPWLPTIEEYRSDESAGSSTRSIEKFMHSWPYIKKGHGERLVYRTKAAWGQTGFMRVFTPGREACSRLHWVEEPEEGWESWEHDNFAGEGTYYADKWQWLRFDFWDKPWDADDASEELVGIPGVLEVQAQGIPFYSLILQSYYKFWRYHVPPAISPNERLEMRKWVWRELFNLSLLKIKIGAFLDEFGEEGCSRRDVEDLVNATFVDIAADIIRGRGSAGELDRVLIKIKETYDGDGEPWWDSCDPPDEEEVKVMLDQEAFFMTADDSRLKQRREHNYFVPENGYFSTAAFGSFAEAWVAVRRYRLQMPDGAPVTVAAPVQMKHIPTLMQFVHGFKVNVPVNSLDMYHSEKLKLVLEDSQCMQEFNYIVDRTTTLVSVCAVALQAHGVICGIIFFFMKMLAFSYQFYTGYLTQCRDRAEAGGADRAKRPLSTRQIAELFLVAFLSVDVMVLFMQAVLIAVLVCGLSETMDPSVSALCCMIIASSTMVFMCAGTFRTEMIQLAEDAQKSFYEMLVGVNVLKVQVRDFLSGGNPLRLNLIGKPRLESNDTCIGKTLTMVVPELGLVFEGDVSLTEEDIRGGADIQEFSKMIDHLPPARGVKHSKHDEHFASVHHHPRYNRDIRRSIPVVMSTDQMLLRSKMPQFAVSLQCINHETCPHSSSAWDSFLTLYKPGGWDTEERSLAEQEEVLDQWKGEIHQWMYGHLCTPVSDTRTRTKEIEEHLNQLLRAKLGGYTHRDMSRFTVNEIRLATGTGSRHRQDVGGLRPYVTMLYDDEEVAEDFPRGRATALSAPFSGSLTKGGTSYLSSGAPLSLDVPMPHSVRQVKFVVWAHMDEQDELIGFTDEMDPIELQAEPVQLQLHCAWKDRQHLGGRYSVEPRTSHEEEEGGFMATCAERFMSMCGRGGYSKLNPSCRNVNLVAPCASDFEPTQSDGYIILQLRDFNEEERQEDRRRLQVASVLAGREGHVSQAMVERHKDEWLDVVQAFGVRLETPDLQELQDHVDKMEKLLPELKATRSRLRREFLFQHGIGRHLVEPEIMEERCKFLREQLGEAWTRAAKTPPLPRQHERIRLIGKRSATQASSKALNPTLLTDIMEKLLDHKAQQQAASQQLLHYVFLGSQIKLSSVGRPDPMVPHRASIVAQQFKDVPEVLVAGYSAGRPMKFQRLVQGPRSDRHWSKVDTGRKKTRKKKKDEDAEPEVPLLVNGRLAFRSKEAIAHQKIFLFWDGSRWVLTPDPEGNASGEQLAEKEEVCFVDENAATPDRITTSWSRWNSGNGTWEADEDIIVSASDLKFKKYDYDSDDDVQDNGALGWLFGELETFLGEFLSLFGSPEAVVPDGQLMDCMVEMGSDQITFRWRHEEETVTHAVPLELVQTMCPDEERVFSNGRKSIDITFRPEAALHTDYVKLRKYINPEYDPATDVEKENMLTVVVPGFRFPVWCHMIEEAQLLFAERIRFYMGNYEDHPLAPGSNMRHGEGSQFWMNGQVYSGQWMNHTYHGRGDLWATAADYEKRGHANYLVFPMYRGDWRDGKRHGAGTLRWQQKISKTAAESVGASSGTSLKVSKVYEGQFVDDLFSGHGKLYAERVLDKLTRSTRKATDRWNLLQPAELHPDRMICFEGSFESHWSTAESVARRRDEVYARTYAGDGKHLELHKISPTSEDGPSRGRFERYYGDGTGLQKSGPAMPDLAQVFYQHADSELEHMKEGLALYSDGWEFEGRLQQGLPEGMGQITLYGTDEPDSDAADSLHEGQEARPWVSKYKGTFREGLREGDGRHETRDGCVYEGQWWHGHRHGEGQQANAEAAYGYSSYRGQWREDKRDGKGTMHMQCGDLGTLIYEGEFWNDMRHGFGVLSREGEALPLYAGDWLRDQVSTAVKPSWLQLVSAGGPSRFYYGQLTPNGYCHGRGSLFDAAVASMFGFAEAMKAGEEYVQQHDPRQSTVTNLSGESSGQLGKLGQQLKAVTSRAGSLVKKDSKGPTGPCVAIAGRPKHEVYCGDWAGNVPHGEGIFVFENVGMYEGQVARGRRHGRGVWLTWDGGWIYRPAKQAQASNWHMDQMHGLAIIEDKGRIHENVIYSNGTCHMPFTTEGPPTTSFEERSFMADFLKNMETVQERTTELVLGQQGGLIALPPETPSSAVPAEAFTAALNTGDSGRVSRNLILLDLTREPTEPDLLEEEVKVTGGTGPNEVLNGIYIRLSDTYGQRVFRLCKRAAGPDRRLAEQVERYMYQNFHKTMWIIAPRPATDFPDLAEHGAGCAYVEDACDHPGHITGCWIVWHPASESLASPNIEEEDEDIFDGREDSKSPRKRTETDVTPPDRLATYSVTGFKVAGGSETHQFGLFTRCSGSQQMYARPVYSGRRGLMLYWMAEGGSALEGSQDHLSVLDFPQEATMDWTDPGSPAAGRSGCWIIAETLGVRPGGSGCLAFVRDLALAPDVIDKNSLWRVAPSFEPVVSMKLEAEIAPTPYVEL
eukprot:TRINITY_DN17231_c0_g1_i2.p1 TRINITY_DN17231_c0_g1~~TRINITY_DN17231_c0_g1_i2.p1  ORF type:complete len:3553 (-),score=663.80 TRINITY_DN17231_c0_g1_i2:169-10827(-)